MNCQFIISPNLYIANERMSKYIDGLKGAQIDFMVIRPAMEISFSCNNFFIKFTTDDLFREKHGVEIDYEWDKNYPLYYSVFVESDRWYEQIEDARNNAETKKRLEER